MTPTPEPEAGIADPVFVLARPDHKLGFDVDACLSCKLTGLQFMEYGDRPCAPRWPLEIGVPLRPMAHLTRAQGED